MTDTTTLGIPELTFAAGLPGFPEARRFAMVRWGDGDGPFSILRSLDQPDLEFLVAPPMFFFFDYDPEIPLVDAAMLGVGPADDALILVIVTLGGCPEDATANLLAPIVVNPTSRLGAQVILDGDYEIRRPLFAAPDR